MGNTKSIEIPEGLYDTIANNLSHLKCDSVSAFVVDAARKALAEQVKHTEDIPTKEKDIIKKRLKDLGYIE